MRFFDGKDAETLYGYRKNPKKITNYDILRDKNGRILDLCL
jgi:hypothetical protein